VSETDEFLDATLPRHHAAGEAMHGGDPTLWLETWSPNEPVTVFGALGVAPRGDGSGQSQLSRSGQTFLQRQRLPFRGHRGGCQ
jgi:hypothetical protein